MLLLFQVPGHAYADGGAPNRAYVAGTPNGVSILDILQQQMIGNLATKERPHMVLLSLDGRFLYVTQPQRGNVTVLAARTGETVCAVNVPGQPTLLALDTTSNILYAAGNGARSVTVFNATDCTIQRILQTDGPVSGLAVAPLQAVSVNGENQIWVSTPKILDVFSSTSNQKLSSVAVEGGAEYLSIPIGSTAYVTTRQGEVFGVDLVSHKLTPLISGGKYGPMDFNEQTGEIFVPDQAHHQLIVLTPINSSTRLPREPARIITLDAAPNSIAITSDGQLGFVAMQDGHVAMLDIPGRQLIKTFQVGGNPQFIITGLNPPVLGTTPQQANILKAVLPPAAYILIILLIIAPFLFYRYRKTRKKAL